MGFLNLHTPEWKCISNDAKVFVKKLLSLQPDQRYSAKQALEDPWIKLFSTGDRVATPIAVQALNNLRTFSVKDEL